MISEHDIQMLENDLDELLVFMDTPKRIAKSLQRILQTEFDHVNWNCPKRETLPRRVEDWVTPIPPNERISCMRFLEKQMEMQTSCKEEKSYRRMSEGIRIVCTATNEEASEFIARDLLMWVGGIPEFINPHPIFHWEANEITLKFDHSISQDDITSFAKKAHHLYSDEASVIVEGAGGVVLDDQAWNESM